MHPTFPALSILLSAMQYLTSKYELPPSFFGDSRRHHLTKIDFGCSLNAQSAVIILLARRWCYHLQWVAFHRPESQIIGHEASVSALLKAKSSYWRFV